VTRRPASPRAHGSEASSLASTVSQHVQWAAAPPRA
jgi:hypothetical protein